MAKHFATVKKWHYRRATWKSVDGMMRGKDIRERKVAILDVAAAHEAKFLVELGYVPELIHVFQDNEREAAAAQTNAPRGVSVWNERLGSVAAWKFDVVSMDTCSCLCPRLFQELQVAALCVRPGGVFVATVLCGREFDPRLRALIADARAEGGSAEWLRSVIPSIAACSNKDGTCRAHALDYKSGSYVSQSGQKLVWSALKLLSHNCRVGRTVFPKLCETDDLLPQWCDENLGVYSVGRPHVEA